MKKVVLGAAALLLTTMAFAQTYPVAPTQSEVIANMSADPTANTGQSTQSGNDNKVMVIQAGTSQSASSYQGDGSGTGGNLALITQVGSVGPNSGVQNNAEVHQQGTLNESITDQQGDYNSALTHQGTINTGSAGNKSWIRQGTGNQGEHNAAEVNQDGDDNIGKIRQTFDSSNALITQLGDDNKAFSTQNASPNNTWGHDSEIRQEGERNESYIEQGGDGSTNAALTVQWGNDNQASQIQDTDGLAQLDGNQAFASQGNPYIGTDLTGTIYYGQLALLDNIQNGGASDHSYGGIVFQNQAGQRNDAEVFQTGDVTQDGNYAEQNQDGEDNDAMIVQNVWGNPNGGANYGRQDQDGDSNQAGISQNGINHRAYQTQDGNDNIAMSTQRGYCNATNIRQLGDQNVGHTAQRGQHNGVLLVQDGGHSYSVQQNLTDGMPNGGNQANILQMGPGGVNPNINCEFPDQLTDNPNWNTPTLTIADVCPDC